MFREDFEFHAAAPASHLGAAATPAPAPAAASVAASNSNDGTPTLAWAADAEKELGKIPFFVRGKARRNTEKFAAIQGVSTITVETLYDAKAHFAR
jgi:light-independent protochlorophyllide reductase subunit B